MSRHSSFCKGEYEGDLAVLQSVVSNVTELPVTLDQDVASKLSKKVLETYIKVLMMQGLLMYRQTQTNTSQLS